jgi:putative membrane protein
MNKTDLTKPTRQSVKGLALIFVQGIRQSVRMFWPLLLIFVLNEKIRENGTILIVAGSAILALLLIHTILYYINFYFFVKDGEFILKKGYLRKKIITIPLDRIQSVNTKQNLFQQILNVVSLEIDTAGSVGKELKIHALEKSFAIELQNKLHSKKAEPVTTEQANPEVEKERSEKVILKLSPVDLLKIGISQNHLRAGLIILAFGNQIYQNISDLFKSQAEKYSTEVESFMENSDWAIIITMILFFLVVSVLFSLFRTLFKYFDFKLLKRDDTFRIESGLINKRNVIIPYSKVQELNWETGPLKSIFGIYHLVFKQAVSKQTKKTQLVDAPGCLTRHLVLLKTDLFGEEVLDKLPKIHSDKFYFKRLWIISGWIPAIIAVPFFYNEWLLWAGVATWLLATAGYNFLVLKKRYFRMNGNQIRISQGAISHKWKQMKLFKIQSVEFKQTIFQKRRALASLKLMNAAGTISIPYIDEQIAKQIYNYLLFHTETSERRWM